MFAGLIAIALGAAFWGAGLTRSAKSDMMAVAARSQQG